MKLNQPTNSCFDDRRFRPGMTMAAEGMTRRQMSEINQSQRGQAAFSPSPRPTHPHPPSPGRPPPTSGVKQPVVLVAQTTDKCQACYRKGLEDASRVSAAAHVSSISTAAFHVAPAMQQPQSATSTPLPWILITRAIKGYSHSFRITCQCAQ